MPKLISVDKFLHFFVFAIFFCSKIISTVHKKVLAKCYSGPAPLLWVGQSTPWKFPLLCQIIMPKLVCVVLS